MSDPPPARPAPVRGSYLRQGSMLVAKAPSMLMREMMKDYRNDMIAMVVSASFRDSV